MNFLEHLTTVFNSNKSKEEKFKNFLIEIKIFGWIWAQEKLVLNEEFMEEYAEELNWSLILKHQDFSPEFGEKFKFNLKKVNLFINHESNVEEIYPSISILSDNTFNSTLRKVNQRDSDEIIEKISVHFSGPKGKILFERINKVNTEIELIKRQIVYIAHAELETTLKKNAIIFRIKTNKKTRESVMFVV